jgi:hypothetical protein
LKATKYLSSSSYPTVGDTLFIFSGIIEHLKTLAEDEDFQQCEIAALISQKIEEYSQSAARENIQSIYEICKERSSSFTDSQKACTSKSTRQYFAQLWRGASQAALLNELNQSTTAKSSELNRYLELPIDEEIDPLLWWQAHSSEFPIVSDMARDFLTI